MPHEEQHDTRPTARVAVVALDAADAGLLCDGTHSIVDFAPTIAAMLGVEMDGVDGRVLPSFEVARRPVPTADPVETPT